MVIIPPLKSTKLHFLDHNAQDQQDKSDSEEPEEILRNERDGGQVSEDTKNTQDERNPKS